MWYFVRSHYRLILEGLLYASYLLTIVCGTSMTTPIPIPAAILALS
jgi:hypothetical protein